MRRVYLSRSRGYAWRLRLWRWNLLICRHVPGEKWHTKPPAAKQLAADLLATPLFVADLKQTMEGREQ